jgi:hypothetical protein
VLLSVRRSTNKIIKKSDSMRSTLPHLISLRFTLKERSEKFGGKR